MPKTCNKLPGSKTFSLVNNPLCGFNLIDASAGTGKTYAICALVLRLLIEKNFSIDQILVVTYTEAATEDLRNRIRQKLRLALAAFDTGQSDDPFLQEYIPHLEDTPRAKQTLGHALRSFDEAAIFTIHSFCQRQLLENSFESNTLFDTELVADDSYIAQELVEDFWRRHFYQGSQLFTEYISDKLSPDTLYSFLKNFIRRPQLQFIPAIKPEEGCGTLSEMETEYCEAYSEVCAAWKSAHPEVRNDLLKSKKLKRNIYKQARISSLLDSMDDMAAASTPSLRLFDSFSLFTSSRIISATRINEVPNILPFYEISENLVKIHSRLTARFDRCQLALKRKLVESFFKEFELRKRKDNIFSFDDLLRKLHRAFSDPGGSGFTRMVAKKYPAVLIDEFQDTDPLQFEIFSALNKKGSLLFLIGDPKQAIYSFRGADIFTYMDAARLGHVSHHTLNINHRSEPDLVRAVNTLFCRGVKPFVFDAITFLPVSPAHKEEPDQLTIDGQKEEPFILWRLDPPKPRNAAQGSSDLKPARLTRTAARQTIINSVVSEVTRLLALAAENRAFINSKRVEPGDIAILVRKNEEARKMQQALAECHLPSVIHSGDNLFATGEARELSYLLEAVAVPQDLPKVKTGLLTRIIGLQPNEIEFSSPESDKAIELWLARFKTYHRLWKNYGFIQMFWTVMEENRVRSRMLGLKDGERILTNILHLAEILHQEASEKKYSITALLGYLQGRIGGRQTLITEQQLRLESDADRVKIVTVHKAKGLEYPIVFCPFTWEGSRLKSDNECVFHQRSGDASRTALIYDGGSPELEAHIEKAMKEELAENIRLLYVAVTRAVHRCYLAWGPIKGAETSGPAYLLHKGSAELPTPQTIPAADETEDDLIRQVRDRFLQLTDSQFKADLKALAADSENTIRISAVIEKPESFAWESENVAIELKPREFTGTVARDWKINSFSSLTTYRTEAEEPDPGQDEFSVIDDPLRGQADDEHLKAEYSIFSFPHGARAGTMLHELLEQVEFNMLQQPETDEIVYNKLLSFGYDPAWQPVLTEMLSNLSRVSLHRNIPGLTLAGIHPEKCLPEMEFYFPLSRISPADFNNIFSNNTSNDFSRRYGSFIEQQLNRLSFSPTRGFMKGFIDLVFEYKGKFYLVDWKSNYLGSQPEYYRHDRLLEAMGTGYYFLQYHLYCLALHLYLKNRMPAYNYATHFGGVFYIFLRGVKQKLGPEYGIFYDLPGPDIIESLADTLLAESDLQ